MKKVTVRLFQGLICAAFLIGCKTSYKLFPEKVTYKVSDDVKSTSIQPLIAPKSIRIEAYKSDLAVYADNRQIATLKTTQERGSVGPPSPTPPPIPPGPKPCSPGRCKDMFINLEDLVSQKVVLTIREDNRAISLQITSGSKEFLDLLNTLPNKQLNLTANGAGL